MAIPSEKPMVIAAIDAIDEMCMVPLLNTVDMARVADIVKSIVRLNPPKTRMTAINLLAHTPKSVLGIFLSTHMITGYAA